jgi:hypothetical protein
LSSPSSCCSPRVGGLFLSELCAFSLLFGAVSDNETKHEIEIGIDREMGMGIEMEIDIEIGIEMEIEMDIGMEIETKIEIGI